MTTATIISRLHSLALHSLADHARAALGTQGLARVPRVLVSGLAATCLLGSTVSSASAGGLPTHVRAVQQLAVLLTAHEVHRAPAATSARVSVVSAHRPITGERTTLPVLAVSTGHGGVRWLQVRLPGRPNGSTGWIAQQHTRKLTTGWRIVVDLAARRVGVYRHGVTVRSFPAVVGKPSTPTPTGWFFVEETVRMNPGEPGGPFALALSARSDVFMEFEGGPGQIGIHGRDDLGGTVGEAESHGCMRLETASIDWLTARVGPGVPVTISAE